MYPVDQFIILGAGVKGVTEVKQVREFWKDKKNVFYHEKIYDEWRAPMVWLDQRSQVEKLLPPSNYFALPVDLDEFFEYPSDKQLQGKDTFAFEQVRLWSTESPTLKNIKTLPLYKLDREYGLLSHDSVRRGGFINSFNSPTITTVGLARSGPITGLYFFHFHFKGLEWFKNKFSKMKYATESPGASRHWKNYTALIQNNLADEKYKTLLADSVTSELADKFKEYIK